MEILAKTIYAENEKEYTKIKNKLINEFNQFNIEYGFIESAYNSEKNGYSATVQYTL